jgi:hypothetical protein
MKNLFVFALFCFASAAQAAAPNNCSSNVVCGSYGEEAEEGGYSTQINVLATASPNQVSLTWINLKNGKDIGGGVTTILTFQPDGSFVGKIGERTYASGVCKNMACTYGIVPTRWDDGKLRAQTGTFNFVNNTLELSIFVPNQNGADFVSKGILTRK